MFKISLLSISLLTIMAGAAVAPGLGEITKAFPGESQTMIKLVLSLPPLFIVPFSILSGILSSRVSKKKDTDSWFDSIYYRWLWCLF